jgi:hypothetical protein
MIWVTKAKTPHFKKYEAQLSTNKILSWKKLIIPSDPKYKITIKRMKIKFGMIINERTT